MKNSTRRLLSGVTAAVIGLSAVNAADLIGMGSSLTAFAEEVTSGVAIDETNFPDKNLRKYVSKFDMDYDGILSESEISAATEIYGYGKGISDFKGIEYLTALTRLYCNSSNLTTLDVSKNTALKELDCSGSKLTTLDVSNNTALTTLQFRNNNLTTLDVSKNTALEHLQCDNNNLTSLDLSNNTALDFLSVQGCSLTTLDISKNTALKELWCKGNNLTSLDVSNNIALEIFDCIGNNLTTLDVSKNTALTTLQCSNNNLTTLDVSQNTALETLACGENNLTSLDLSNNTAFKGYNCQGNQYTLTSVSLDELIQYGFDASKTSNWTGAEYDSATNSLKNITAEKVTYKYDTGYAAITFTLVIDINNDNDNTPGDDDNDNDNTPGDDDNDNTPGDDDNTPGDDDNTPGNDDNDNNTSTAPAPKTETITAADITTEQKTQLEQSANNIVDESEAAENVTNGDTQAHKDVKADGKYSLRIVQMVDSDLLKNAESVSITIYSAKADKYVTITAEYCCSYLDINGTKVEADDDCSFLTIVINNVQSDDVITFTDYTINYKK